MPGYSTNKGTTRPDSRPGKRQQNSLGGISGQEQQTQHDKGGCSPATALAVFGAKRKRKRSEASASERGYTQQADESTSQTTGVASVVQPSNAAASDQQKAKQSPASLPSKSKSNSKRPKSRFKSLDSEYDPEDEIPLYTLAQKQKPATPVGGRHSDSKQQVNGLSTQKPQQRKAADSGSKQLANGFSTQSTQRNAAAAASAVAFFGTSRRGQGKPLSPLAANSGKDHALESSEPSRGLTELVSRISSKSVNQGILQSGVGTVHPSRQSNSQLPPPHLSSHYGLYRNLTYQACRTQQIQLALAEAPFRDAAKSGVASFAYSEAGFVTFPFSVSAFGAESKAAMSRLEEFMAAAQGTQEPDHHLEAASLRVAPLEEQQQAAIQAAMAEAEREDAKVEEARRGAFEDRVVTHFRQAPQHQHAAPPIQPSCPPTAAAKAAALKPQQPRRSALNVHTANKLRGLVSVLSGPPPPALPRSHTAPKPPHAAVMPSAAAGTTQGAVFQGPSRAPLGPVPDLTMAEAAKDPSLPQEGRQLCQQDATEAGHILSAESPSGPSAKLAPVLGTMNPAAAAVAAVPIPPGLPSVTAAVAAASDALIATFSSGNVAKAPATAAPADPPTVTAAAVPPTTAAAALPATSADAAAAPTPTAAAPLTTGAAPPTNVAAAAVGSILTAVTNGSEVPHMTEAADSRAPPSNAAAPQEPHGSHAAGVAGRVSAGMNSMQLQAATAATAATAAAAAADVARRPGNGEQPDTEAAACGPPPGNTLVQGAGPPQSKLGSRGLAALAAMPKIGPAPGDEDVSCVNVRYRPRTVPPVKVLTRERVELQDTVAHQVRAHWLEGLNQAAKVLTSLSTAQQNKSDAGRRRWDRNVAVEGPKRLTHAEAFAQRAHRSPHGAWQGAKSELHDGPLVSTQCSQSLGIPPLPTDTVLTFTVHRFDRPGKLLVTVAVLGRQKLTVLRDTIKCEADANFTKNKTGRPSACLYLEGEFFNDMRDERAMDMSYNIREFCQKHAITVPPAAPTDPPPYPPGFHKSAQAERPGQCQPRAQKMEDTTFGELFLRVGQGAGYVYMHQGCCEHLVELSDVRCIHHAELLQSQPTFYPLVLKEAIRQRRDCKMCKMASIDRRADWVTYNDRNAPTNPAFWCEDCYRQMHYDSEGNACYQDYSAFSYMYEYGNLKQRRRSVEAVADEMDDL